MPDYKTPEAIEFVWDFANNVDASTIMSNKNLSSEVVWTESLWTLDLEIGGSSP